MVILKKSSVVVRRNINCSEYNFGFVIHDYIWTDFPTNLMNLFTDVKH